MTNMQNTLTNKAFRTLFYSAAVVAFIAIFPIETYGFYIFLRYLLFTAFIAVFIKLDDLNDKGVLLLAALFGAVLFNPFMIIEHEKSTWVIFDLIAAGIFAYCGVKMDENIIEDEKRAFHTSIEKQERAKMAARRKI